MQLLLQGTFLRMASGGLTNVLGHQEICRSGAYFVTPNVSLATGYLERVVHAVLIRKKPPGQEADVLRSIPSYNASSISLLGARRLRDHILRAAEGYSLAQLSPKTLKLFNVASPAAEEYDDRRVMFLPMHSKLHSLGFDGLFGVIRALKHGMDVRTKRPIGRPRQTLVNGTRRSASCKTKNKVRQCLPARLGGRLFVVDCKKGRGNVLVGYEFINNENTTEQQQSCGTSVTETRGAPRHDACAGRHVPCGESFAEVQAGRAQAH